MREATMRHPGRTREILFAACVLCTLWLLLQNSILLSWLLHGQGPGLFAAARSVARALLGAALPFALIPLAFVLGWAASRAPGPRRAMETRHER